MSVKIRKHITLPENLYNVIEEPIINYQFNGDFSAFVVFCINLYISVCKSQQSINKARRENATPSSSNNDFSNFNKDNIKNNNSIPVNKVVTKEPPIIKANKEINDASTVGFIDNIISSLE